MSKHTDGQQPMRYNGEPNTDTGYRRDVALPVLTPEQPEQATDLPHCLGHVKHDASCAACVKAAEAFAEGRR